jgi:hypothetical protein
MDNSFFAYLQQLEMMAFFSGFPLIYAIVIFISGKPQSKTSFKSRLVSLLPVAYALVGVLFLGLQLKNLYPDYSIEHINETVQSPYLLSWALLSLLFFLPLFRKRPSLCLYHSLVFFIFVAKDILSYLFKYTQDKSVLKNAMNIYTNSLLLNLGILIFTFFVSLVFHFLSKKSKSIPL